jgi:hypothetical protein
MSAVYIRGRSPEAPIKRLALRFFIGCTIAACISACVVPHPWRGWATVATALLAIAACLIATEAEKAVKTLLGIGCIALGISLFGLDLGSNIVVGNASWLEASATVLGTLGVAYIYGNEKLGHLSIFLLTIFFALYMAYVKHVQNLGAAVVVFGCGFMYLKVDVAKKPLIYTTPMAFSLASAILAIAVAPTVTWISFTSLAGMGLSSAFYAAKPQGLRGTLALVCYGCSLTAFGLFVIQKTFPVEGSGLLAGGIAVIGHCIIREPTGILSVRSRVHYFLNGPSDQTSEK